MDGRSGYSKVGMLILLTMGAVSLLAPYVAPLDPHVTGAPFLPPGRGHILGTNDLGQDIFSELVYRARASLAVAMGASGVAVLIGSLVGMVSGYWGGRVEDALMALADVTLVVPGLPFLVVLAAYLKPGLKTMALIMGFLWWGSVARLVRSEVLSVKSAAFVEASVLMGASRWWIVSRHIAPNLLPIVSAKFVLTAGAAMAAEAGLSFLGLGDPAAKSWGTMLHFAFCRGGLTNDLWWWYLPPGLCISASILGLSFLGISLEEKSDPRLRRLLRG